jgi:predicted nuclease of predicted toxin-antitoxin system
MRFLVDESLSARIVAVLADEGHEATHVTQVGLAATPDAVILRAAAESGSVVLTADVDFGTLLALGGEGVPSVVTLRSSDHLAPDEQAALVLAAIVAVGEQLEKGAIATVTSERIRLRTLPIGQD